MLIRQADRKWRTIFQIKLRCYITQKEVMWIPADQHPPLHNCGNIKICKLTDSYWVNFTLGNPLWQTDNINVSIWCIHNYINTLRTGDADMRLYITTVQDGWRKSAFLTRAWFPRTIHLITQYMEHFSEWSCWRMFIETRVFGEYFLKISVHKNS